MEAPDDDVVDDVPEEEIGYHSENNEDEESSDEEMESYGVELNNRLLVATAAREQGADVPLDEDWEQWLKEAVERGGYTDMINAIRTGQPLSFSSNHPSSSLPVPSTTGIAAPSALISEQFLLSTPTNMVPPIMSPNSALQRSSDYRSGTPR